jgi:hypothetical protein
MRKKINHVDANQSEIVKALRRQGALVIDCTGDSTIGFDLLVAYRGWLIPVEVKDGAKAASDRKLTENEKTRQRELAEAGVTLVILESLADVERLFK